LDGLFVYLSDPNVDVRTATLNVLGDFLKEIVDSVTFKTDKVDDGNSLPDIERLSMQTDDLKQKLLQKEEETKVDFPALTSTLVVFLSSLDEETRATALRWINTFINLSRNEMLPFTPLLLTTILPTLSHQVQAIKSLAIDANTTLFTLVFDWSSTRKDPFDTVLTVTSLMKLCQDESEDTRVGALEWLLMLHKKYPKQVMNSDQTFFHGLLKTLSDYSEEVVRRDLELLAQISHTSDDEYFTKFMVNLLNLFTIDRRLLETRGGLIIRQLCLSLNPERMYRSFGEILEQEMDLEFAGVMVQTLNLILVTAPELYDMRSRLKNIDSREGSALFCALYRSWW
jgi:vacuole morphology and inheritance protein 14